MCGGLQEVMQIPGHLQPVLGQPDIRALINSHRAGHEPQCRAPNCCKYKALFLQL